MTLLQSFQDYLNRKYPDSQIQIVPDTSISFTIDNLNFKFAYSSNESAYFRLMLPRVNTHNAGINELCRIACEMSYSYKVGKIGLIENDFWICYEQLLDPGANNDFVYGFSIRILTSMIADFRNRISRLGG